ncbi:MAG: hypothetical protein ABIP94_19890 [Planctomycetota bacterium]
MRLPLTTAFLLPLLLTAGACTSIDGERNRMHSLVTDADRLGVEISQWRTTVQQGGDEKVVTTIASFKERANDTQSALRGLSNEARSGTDTTGLDQALRTVADFNTSTFAAASPNARAALLDQFDGLARNLRASVARLRERG